MIQLRCLPEGEIPNPEIHLGINGLPIDIKLFKGLWSEAGTIYSSDMYGNDVQVIIAEDEKTATIVDGENTNSYLLKEDLQNFDRWMKISYSVFGGESFFTQTETLRDKAFSQVRSEVLDAYYRGDTSDILSSTIEVHNDKGEYINVGFTFDLNRHEKLEHRLKDHLSIVGLEDYLTTLPDERKFIVEGPTQELEYLKKYILEDALRGMPQNNLNSKDFERIMHPAFGDLVFKENNDLKRFIVRVR